MPVGNTVGKCLSFLDLLSSTTVTPSRSSMSQTGFVYRIQLFKSEEVERERESNGKDNEV